VLVEKIVLNPGTKIAHAITLGFLYGSFIVVPQQNIDHFLHFSTVSFPEFIKIPEFIERIFSIPGTVLWWTPSSGLLGSFECLVIMFIVQFIMKRKSKKPILNL
jgi:hypothetical protein